MARNYVKDAEAVRNLNDELRKSAPILEELTGESKDLAQAVQNVVEAHSKSLKYSSENVDAAKQQSRAGKDIIDVIKAQNKGSILGTVVAKAKLKVNRLIHGQSEEITKELYNQYDAQQKVNEESAELSKNQKRLNALTGGLVSKTKDMQESFEDSGVSINGPMAFGLVAVGGILAGFFKILTGFSQRIDNLGKSFGVMGPGLATSFMSAERSFQMIGLSGEDVLTMTNNLSDSLGIGVEEAMELSKQVADSGVAMGLSVDESSQLFGNLMKLGGLSADQAENFAESTSQLAQANKVNPTSVMKDIAKSSELIAKYGADNLDSIGKAAVQAKKLGLELSTVDKISSSLLDFQSSITSQFEAEIILGRRLNLQSARRLALEGDLSSMMDEVLMQVGGEAKFNKLNVLERQALADVIGVSVSEMAKLVQKTKELEPPKTFFEMLGDETQSSLTNLMERFTDFGLLFIDKIGPSLEKAGIALLDFLTNTGFITKVTTMTETFADTVGKKIDGTVKWFESLGPAVENMSASIMGFLNLMANVASIATGAMIGAQVGAFFGPPGIAAGAVIGAVLGYFGKAVTFGNMMGGGTDGPPPGDTSGGGGTGGGGDTGKLNDFIQRDGFPAQSFSPDDTIVGVKGEFVDLEPLYNAISDSKNSMTNVQLELKDSVDLNPLINSINSLRSDMKEYFNGQAGTAVRAIGSRTADELIRLSPAGTKAS